MKWHFILSEVYFLVSSQLKQLPNIRFLLIFTQCEEAKQAKSLQINQLLTLIEAQWTYNVFQHFQPKQLNPYIIRIHLIYICRHVFEYKNMSSLH